MQENGKNFHISGVGGDVFGIDISGRGVKIGKNIANSEMVNLDSDMLKEVTHLYAEVLKNIFQSTNEQLTTHDIQKLHLSQIQEKVNQLVKENVSVKVHQKVRVQESTSIKIRLINLDRNIWKVLPKSAETVTLFTLLDPFSKLIGELTQFLIEHV